jgi:hypothetical protein
LHAGPSGVTNGARFRAKELAFVKSIFRWTPLLPALLVSACALDLDGKDRCRGAEDCPTHLCVQGRCAVERPPAAADAPMGAVEVADAGEADAPAVDLAETGGAEAPAVDLAGSRDAACLPGQPARCAADGFDVCGADGAEVHHTSCEGRGCLEGACCPAGQEVVAAACQACGKDGEPCCHGGGACRCAPGLAQCEGLCFAVPATVCVRKLLGQDFFAATFCELKDDRLRFDCATEKTRACGPAPGNANILVYGEYHPGPTGRAEPLPRYWCCPGCRVATDAEVAGEETCQREARRPCRQ